MSPTVSGLQMCQPVQRHKGQFRFYEPRITTKDTTVKHTMFIKATKCVCTRRDHKRLTILNSRIADMWRLTAV